MNAAGVIYLSSFVATNVHTTVASSKGALILF